MKTPCNRLLLMTRDTIVIIFVLTPSFHALWWTVLSDFQTFLLLAKSLLTLLSFISHLITTFHVFLGCHLRKLPLTLKVLYLRDQAFSSILSSRPNHCSLLSCKHCFMLFNFSLVLTLLIYLTILASFLSSLITCSSLTGQDWLPYSITLNTHAEHDLPFASKGKPPLANKGTKSLNLLHLLLILVTTVSTATFQLLLCHQDN